jgi:4-amino-4-deoxy-L-arabinose transferase-like glycosyltransferase
MSTRIPGRWWLAVLIATGLLLRMAAAWKLGLNKPPTPGSDASEMDTYAWNLAQGRGYRGMSPDVADADHLTAYRPPGFALVWAPLYRLAGHRYDVVRVIHCVAGAATILLVFLIGQHCFDNRVAWLAASVWTVWPFGLLYSSELLAEALATLWLLWYVWASLQFAEKPTPLRALYAGLLLGIALLTRPSTALLLPLVAFWAVWQFRRQRRVMAQALTIPVISVAILIPWAWRNYRVFNKFIPISTMGGSVLLQGSNDIVATNPAYYGFSVWDTKINDEITSQLKAPNNEYERDKVAGRIAIEWLKSHRDKWGYLLQARFRRSWTPFLQQSSKVRRLGTLVIWGPILVLFAASFFPTLIKFLRDGNSGWMIHLAILHYAISSMVFYALARYRFPIEGLCIILACATVMWAWDRVFQKQHTA